LHDALFRPVAALLAHEKRVTIVPDGFLWNVAFDALMAPSRKFLIESHVFSYAPSVAMLDAAARRGTSHSTTRHTLLALGNPLIEHSTRERVAATRDLSLGALPDAEREVNTLATLYGRGRSTVLTGPAARETAFKQIAGD